DVGSGIHVHEGAECHLYPLTLDSDGGGTALVAPQIAWWILDPQASLVIPPQCGLVGHMFSLLCRHSQLEQKEGLSGGVPESPGIRFMRGVQGRWALAARSGYGTTSQERPFQTTL